MKSVCLAILNYNGVKHLEHMLPTTLEVVAEYGQPCPIVILDNRSPKGDPEWVAKHFPTVEVVTAPANDFLYSYNWLLTQRREDIVIILNNDLRLCPGFLAPLLKHFDQADVFAVGATSLDWEGTIFTCGPARLQSHHGQYFWDWDRDRQSVAHTLFASGGFMAVDRVKFNEIGGFNRLFHPAYGEDLDLCFRAWRKGWRTIFEPASVTYHRENASWKEVRNDRSARLILRAQLLFQWASIPPSVSWFERVAFFWLTAWRKFRTGESWWLRVWFSTWMEWRRQRKQYRDMKASPEEMSNILSRIAKPVGAPAK